VKALLHPESVAIVGASGDASKTTGRPLRFLRQAGYRGRVYPVNPTRDSVQGERAWPSIEALPEAPEHAYIVTSTDAAIDAVEACGRRGVKVATVLAAGFGEVGDDGVRREEQLRAIVASTGIRVVGPSSLGIVNVLDGVMLTANAAFAEPDLPRGSIFVASHSGSMIGSLLSRGKARGVGFAGLVSVGGEVDLSLGEICAATLDDPAITGYMLFLETLRRADDLRRFAIAAAGRGKAILAYKLGRSSAAAELAMTHTGALAGEDDVADAFLRDCGIPRVHTLDGLIEGMALTLRHARAGGHPVSRVAIVTTTGGGAAMVVDQLGIRGIEVARFIDLTLAGTKYDVMKRALDEALASPEFDLVLAVPGSSARFEPELAVRPIIDSAGAEKPLAAFVVPDAPQALAALTAAAVPNFRTPEACADAIASLRHAAKPVPRDSRAPPANTVFLDELEAYRVLGVPHARVEAVRVDDVRTALAFPVAVKALSAETLHKSRAGGVVLDVRDPVELKEAVAYIRSNLPVDRVLVQEMTRGEREALVGYRVDSQVGPIVIVAAGGVLTEIYRDRSIRIAPVDAATAREMIAEVKALNQGDLEALAGIVVALSRLAQNPAIVEAELNPVIVQEKGAVAVDALVRVERS
jgi:acyl-CoA synthetase (NDP forming)